ncbi:MAG: Acetyl-CoA:oxalate CoA-transferase [Nitrospira sp.]|nr:Acetyl-CoA:oxalate CoA-transferase [Nitrospira sp.]
MTTTPRETLGALAGLRVLDLGRILSAPLCARVLADLGAEVIKVEAPTGDDSRAFGPFYEGQSSYFRLINRNKYGITVDLKTEEGGDTLTRLIKRSDVVIENFRTGVLDRLGFPPERLLQINPRLVVASISGFGRDTPLEGLPAYDLIVQALSGLMSVTGPEGGDGVRVGISIGDIVPGLFAVIAILAALEERRTTGRGQHIDVSMLDGMISVLESIAMKALYTDQELRPTGSHQAVSAPYGTFTTAEGHIAIAIANDALFVRLAKALDHPEWLTDPRYASDFKRGVNRCDLQVDIEDALSRQSAQDAIRNLESAGIPCSPVLSVREALAHPHVAARELLIEEADGFRTLNNGFRMRGSRHSFTIAPRLGQHNDMLQHWLSEPPRDSEPMH